MQPLGPSIPLAVAAGGQPGGARSLRGQRGLAVPKCAGCWVTSDLGVLGPSVAGVGEHSPSVLGHFRDVALKEEGMVDKKSLRGQCAGDRMSRAPALCPSCSRAGQGWKVDAVQPHSSVPVRTCSSSCPAALLGVGARFS